MAESRHLYRVDYAALRKEMQQRLNQGAFSPAVNERIGDHIRFDTFTGATPEQAKKWLEKGFEIKAAKTNDHGDVYAKPRRRMRWSDDGDLDVGQVLVGTDFPYFKWDQRLRKPGLALVAEFDFNGHVDGKLLTDYGAWLLSQIKRFELNGYDLDVSLALKLKKTYQNPAPHKVDLRIVLKRENEASDSRLWSPMFSPMGFRGYGFLAIGICGVENKWQTTYGLGQADTGSRWGVLFNGDTRTLTVLCPGNGQQQFDADRMTEMLNDALPEAS